MNHSAKYMHRFYDVWKYFRQRWLLYTSEGAGVHIPMTNNNRYARDWDIYSQLWDAQYGHQYMHLGDEWNDDQTADRKRDSFYFSAYAARRECKLGACARGIERLRWQVNGRLAAERLPFPDGSFDFVYGNGVLHHVDFLSALQEVKRVLRPGGKAAFIEPLAHNPLIHIYRKMAEKVRTETEAPLSMQDLRAIRRIFPHMEHQEF